MLFTSPHYPLFLAAVFALYGLSRSGRWPGVVARVALMTLIGDVVWLVLTHDVSTLWDPLGVALFSLLPDAGPPVWWHVVPGGLVLAGAVVLGCGVGRRSDPARGQLRLAALAMALLVVMGGAVLLLWCLDLLAALTATLRAVGHLAYLCALGVALGAAATERGRAVGRVLILLLVSAVFYHAWAAAQTGAYVYLLALIVFTIVLDYYLALAIEASPRPATRRALLAASVVSNLGILAMFKYADFFTHDVLQLEVGTLGLILPAGISFHTFQSLSYTIDVYRGEIRATRRVTELATYVLFFPQLVAGPIVRAKDLLPQISDLPPFDHHRAADGLHRILLGLFKKIALADFLAVALADRVFDHPELYSSVEVACGVYAYAFQIYLDFSAYSDIAIGSAQLLGFRLPENFRTPYRAGTLQDFWHRWHISLSTWLRDYLYIPLGGSRGGELATYRNLMVTMLLGGLWHGASWTFIAWGFLHGGGLAVTRYYQRRVERDPAGGRRLLVVCGAVAIIGATVHAVLGPIGGDPWPDLIVAWCYGVPLWAMATAWLGRAPAPAVSGRPRPELAALVRVLAGAALVVLLASLQWGRSVTWLPLVVVVAGYAWLADAIEVGPSRADAVRWIRWAVRRGLAVVLVFHYVCLAWVFFRAQGFDRALAVLDRIAAGEWDAPNLIPAIQVALAAALAAHFFAPRTFRWLRDRFVAAPAPIQGLVLTGCALVLRELAAPTIVPFIYFQF